MNKFKKVLIIDDEFVDTFIIKNLMQQCHFAHEFVLIDSSQDAYDYINEEINSHSVNFPEVIFLDINMPMYNGFELLDKIETLVKMYEVKTQVCILTSSNYIEDKIHSNSFKTVTHYFSKPLTIEMLDVVK